MSEYVNNAPAPAAAKRKRVVTKAVTTSFFREGPNNASGGKFSLAFEVMSLRQQGKEAVVECGEIIGQITSYVAKELIDKQGEIRTSTMFLGTFRATRRFDGAVIDCPGLYLPTGMTNVFRAQCDSGQVPFMFAYDIDAVPNPIVDAAIPYEWRFATKMPVTFNDPLEQISRLMHDGLSKPTTSLQGMLPGVSTGNSAALEHAPQHDTTDYVPDEDVSEAAELATAEVAPHAGKGKGDRLQAPRK